MRRISKDAEPNYVAGKQMAKVAQEANIGTDYGLFSAVLSVTDVLRRIADDLSGLREDLKAEKGA